jgi:hypothetical protein
MILHIFIFDSIVSQEVPTVTVTTSFGDLYAPLLPLPMVPTVVPKTLFSVEGIVQQVEYLVFSKSLITLHLLILYSVS